MKRLNPGAQTSLDVPEHTTLPHSLHNRQDLCPTPQRATRRLSRIALPCKIFRCGYRLFVCLFVCFFFLRKLQQFCNLLIFFEVFIFQSALKVKRKNKQTNKTKQNKITACIAKNISSVKHVEIPQLLINDFITNSKCILDSDWLKEHV